MDERQQRANALIAQAGQHQQAHENDEAIRLYREAIALMADVPPYVSYNLVLGDLLFQLQRYREAAECYRQLVDAFPEHDQGWSGLGQALALLGEEREALQAFEQCVVLVSDDAPAWYHGAVLHARRGDDATAAQWLRRALKLQPAWRERAASEPVLAAHLAAAGKKWWQFWK